MTWQEYQNKLADAEWESTQLLKKSKADKLLPVFIYETILRKPDGREVRQCGKQI
jgi:hypothetical protein